MTRGTPVQTAKSEHDGHRRAGSKNTARHALNSLSAGLIVNGIRVSAASAAVTQRIGDPREPAWPWGRVAMVYRKVTKWRRKEFCGAGCKRIAARLGLDVKTVRSYVHAAQALGLTCASGHAALTDELLTALLASVRTQPGRSCGDAWESCQAHRDRIAELLKQGLRLSKLRKRLLRQGVQVLYPTLHRFAVAELGFCRTAATVPIADCAPGEELKVDTGWMGYRFGRHDATQPVLRGILACTASRSWTWP